MSDRIRAWLLAPVLDYLRSLKRELLKEIAMNMQDLAAELQAVAAQAEKSKAEIVAAVGALTDHVAELEAAIAAGAQTSPEVDAALALVKGDVQALDDLNADATP